MPKKPLAFAAIAIATTATFLPTDASAGDPGLGALFGAAVGAAIGHGVNGHDGAIVGGVLGAVTGASIAASSGGHYAHGYAAPAAYGPPAYVPAAPAYYAPPRVVVRPRPVVVYRVAPYPLAYAPVVVARPHHWRHGGRHDGRGPRWR
jgi:hypothetical protein